MNLAVLVVVILATSASAQEVPRALPAKAGLDPAKLAALRPRLQDLVDRQQLAGAVALVARHGQVGVFEAVGLADREAGTAMKPDTIFQIASMTKPVTALAVMMLEEAGKLAIDDPVEQHLPEFKGQWMVKERSAEAVTLVKPPRPITVKDLLTHTSGLRGDAPPGLADLYQRRNRTLAEATIAYAMQPLDFAPGTKWSYCNAGIDTLGRLVEVVSGQAFEAFLHERLFAPLGMKDTFFYPTPERQPRIAAIYKKDGDKLARAANFIGDGVGGRFPVPAGGLYSTAADLLRLYRMVLARGELDGRRTIKAATIDKMTRVQFADAKTGFTPGMGMGLGFQVVAKPEGVTAMLSPGTHGHGGAFGTQGWIDPRQQMIFILLVQRQGFGNGDASDLRQLLQSVSVGAIRK